MRDSGRLAVTSNKVQLSHGDDVAKLRKDTLKFDFDAAIYGLSVRCSVTPIQSRTGHPESLPKKQHPDNHYWYEDVPPRYASAREETIFAEHRLLPLCNGRLMSILAPCSNENAMALSRPLQFRRGLQNYTKDIQKADVNVLVSPLAQHL